MSNLQNAREYAKDQMQQDQITAAQANVLIVQIAGIMVVKNKLPKEVRSVLNGAVKNGELGKVKKDGLKPEIYHHKNARAKALEEAAERARIEHTYYGNLHIEEEQEMPINDIVFSVNKDSIINTPLD